ncbi:hypothetical protein [uncultured Ilyobacter sp.]|uniref:hypothetical protein n=1 Tax=uncultured Ilyobacter sp. TaxID=544433 RepID=UPI0029F46A88|nr:hypothetical protein [uncultured Ilyobacter sp.]
MVKYDNSFKKNIAEVVHNKIKTKTEIQREYGIAPSTVVGWEKKYFGELKNKENLTDQDLEIIRLKKLLQEKEEEVEILKKAAAIFSKGIK